MQLAEGAVATHRARAREAPIIRPCRVGLPVRRRLNSDDGEVVVGADLGKLDGSVAELPVVEATR